jgi:hypothetical protein
MKRIARCLTELALAVLLFVVSAHAQFERRMTANIPFEFTVGSISLPAGRYEFMRTDDDIYQVRDADGHILFAMASASIQSRGLPGKSMLKFAIVDGRHVLTQIWNERADIGNEFHHGQSHEGLAKQPTIPGAVAGR